MAEIKFETEAAGATVIIAGHKGNETAELFGIAFCVWKLWHRCKHRRFRSPLLYPLDFSYDKHSHSLTEQILGSNISRAVQGTIKTTRSPRPPSACTPGSGRQVGNTVIIDRVWGKEKAHKANTQLGGGTEWPGKGKPRVLLAQQPQQVGGAVCYMLLHLTFWRSAAGLQAGCTSVLLVWSCQMVSQEWVALSVSLTSSTAKITLA